MSLQHDVERVLERLSSAQVAAVAAAAERGASLAGAVVGARPAAVEAVSRLSSAEVSGAGIALALRVGLAARETAQAVRSRPVWTGPGSAGEQRLTAGVLHELITGARSRVLLMSYAAHTLPAVATDLEAAVAAGRTVDVVFETGSDSSGEYSAHDRHPFGAVAGIRRWRWPADQRAQASVLHAKALVIDGERALIGSANLTKRALTANLEVGVLIRDPAVAAALEAHVRALMERGVLVRDSDS
ncbi:MAG: DISARM system phospholipase D-like protein DrmC [Solirubrobacteraceae bacterium]